MADVIRDVLTKYYGIGINKNKKTRALSSHEASNIQKDYFHQLSSVDSNINDNSNTKNSSLNETISTDRTANGRAKEIFRSSRVITDVDSALLSDDEDTDPKAENENWLEEATAGPRGIFIEQSGAADDGTPEGGSVLQDSASDRSLLSTKKNTKRRQAASPAPPTLFLRTPPLKKSPNYNAVFCDIANAAISDFPLDLLPKIHGIKMLYLGNNSLTELPADLFTTLKSLQFLDVRRNQLSTLPPTIKHHLALETILLQDNRFERLPLELCLIPNLTALQVTDNPLVFPPKSVVEHGFHAIMEALKHQQNLEGHEDVVLHPKKIKSLLTVLSDDPPIYDLSKARGSCSSTDPLQHVQKPSVREKSMSYKPNNRCRISGPNQFLQDKLDKLATVREKLMAQAAVLQRIKDREALKQWRQSEKSVNKSFERALRRTTSDFPFAVEKTSTGQRGKRHQSCEDINIAIAEISASLKRFEVTRDSGHSNRSMELTGIEEKINKLMALQEKITNLKRQNLNALKPHR